MPAVYFPVEIAYTTVHKERAGGRVVSVEQRIVLGSKEQVEAVLAEGSTAATMAVIVDLAISTPLQYDVLW